ncbi:MAG: hypothetical protein HUK05_07150 [Prevotella sp.]|mgnify:CR=1 FL=1|nr:hypothetical protein [Prevotella sp.]MCF0209615.1 hypothetical protein [Bacteroidaceae bacterium]
MNQQIIINVTKPSILSSLRKILGAMDGVTIERPRRQAKKASAKAEEDQWQTNPVVIDSIKRGESDLQNGRCQQMTAKEIREMLGV